MSKYKNGHFFKSGTSYYLTSVGNKTRAQQRMIYLNSELGKLTRSRLEYNCSQHNIMPDDNGWIYI